MGQELESTRLPDDKDPLQSNDVSALMNRAAMLDAMGATRTEIARQCGVTGRTVSAWRGTRGYKKAVERFLDHSLRQLEASLVEFKHQYTLAGVKAIESAIEALSATDISGQPLWPVRLEAMRLLIDKQIIEREVGRNHGDGGGATAAAAAYIVVRTDGSPAPEIIEGQAVEV